MPLSMASSGLLVRPRDPQALVAAIVELRDNADLRARLGAAARTRVQSQFSLDACVRRYLNLYEGVAKRDAAPIQALIG